MGKHPIASVGTWGGTGTIGLGVEALSQDPTDLRGWVLLVLGALAIVGRARASGPLRAPWKVRAR